MSKSRDLMAMMYAINAGSGYSDTFITDDIEVNECLMDMYFYMMLINTDNEKKKDEYFQSFENSFRKLNHEQQELVRQEYMDIIHAQSKNKEKVKKKGMNDYE